jgi:1,2-diacylglycerol 3-beta-galactosyltransferase
MGTVSRSSAISIMQAIVNYRPDLIVSVHPLVQQPTLYALRRLQATIPYTIVVTDLASVHPLWFHPAAARCFVASETAFQAGRAAGLSLDQLRLYGLPVRPIFADPARPKTELRAELGMDLTRPAALLVGGGEGIGRVADIAQAVAAALGRPSAPAGQLAIICGRNRRLLTALQQEAWPIPVSIKGFVGNMSDWMAASDCIITKAGPGTIAEALIRELPIILSGFIPGQEEGNVPFVLDNEVGVLALEPEDIARRVCAWFGPERDEMARLAANAKRLGNPRSTHQIVHELASLITAPSPSTGN